MSCDIFDTTEPFLQFRRVAMNPAHDGVRLNINTALLHHLRQIAIGDPVLAVPANAHKDDLTGKRRRLNLNRFLGQKLQTTSLQLLLQSQQSYLVSKVLPSHGSARRDRSSCEASLKRLGVDALDLYLLHWQGLVALEETVGLQTAARAKQN